MSDVPCFAACPQSELRNFSLPCGSDSPPTTFFYYAASSPIGSDSGDIGVPAMSECDRMDSIPDRKILLGKPCAAPPSAAKAVMKGWEVLQFLGDHKFRRLAARWWPFRLFGRQTKLSQQPAAARYLSDGTRIEVPLLSHLIAYGCIGGEACQGIEPWSIRTGELSFIPPTSKASGADTLLFVGKAWADFKVKVAGEAKAEVLISLRSVSRYPMGGLRVFVGDKERMGPVHKQPGIVGYALELPAKQVHRVRLEYTFGVIETRQEAAAENAQDDDLRKQKRAAKDPEGVWITALAVRNGEFTDAATPEGEVRPETSKTMRTRKPKPHKPTSAAAAAPTTTSTATAAPVPPPPPPSTGTGDDADEKDAADLGKAPAPPPPPPASAGGLDEADDQSAAIDDDGDPLSTMTLISLGVVGAVALASAGYVAWKWRRGPPVVYTQIGGRRDKIELADRNGRSSQEAWGDFDWDDEEEDDMLHPRGER